jgi:tetratricopeptide (TPR) repeat protein
LANARQSHQPVRSFRRSLFTPRFALEPGQRIFTIGSCFARSVEAALADRGFDVPTLAVHATPADGSGILWGGDRDAVLNNYVPAAIAPQIRWAFGMDAFDMSRHAVPMGRDRYVDLQVPSGFRPLPAEAIVRRRDAIGRIYRGLADSHVVVITLGLIEAWDDKLSGLYINCPPPKSVVRSDPLRFELRVLDYNEVVASLEELVGLLGQVCPTDHRVILTVSPVPLQATFTTSDVAVANAYSKSVLRAAVEPLVAGHDHIEYFPSCESVVLTDRSVAYANDQVHVEGALVRFNVDRMIRRYAGVADGDAVADVIRQVRADAKAGLFRTGLKRLQKAWAENAGDPKLAIELARAQFRAGNGAVAESLLLQLLEAKENVAARNVLARYYNDTGRHEEAALHTEKASEALAVRRGRPLRLRESLQRVIAYYHLQRFEEGLAVLNQTAHDSVAKSQVIYWKARFLEKLDRADEAEASYRECNQLGEQIAHQSAFADFLAAQGRWVEAAEWVDRILVASPGDKTALRLRTELRRREVAAGPSRQASYWFVDLARRVGRTLPFRARREAATPDEPG